MSTLFVEKSIELVHLTLNTKDGSSTTEFWIGNEYKADSGYGFSHGTVYPILAEQPQARRAAGKDVGIRFPVSIRVYGNTWFEKVGQTFWDLTDEYEFHGSTAEIRYYPIAADGTTSHATANITQTLEITGISWDNEGQTVTIECNDTWFKDKELSRLLDTSYFTELDPSFDREYGAWAFGQDVIIDTPIIDKTTAANAFDIFAGWETSAHQVQTVTALHVANSTPALDDRGWLPVAINPDDPLAGDTLGPFYASGGSAAPLTDNWYALAFLPSEPTLIASICVELQEQGTVADGDGELRVDIYAAEKVGGAGTQFQPKGAPLSTVQFRASQIGSASRKTAGFEPIIAVSDKTHYMAILSWTNLDDTTNYIQTYTKTTGTHEVQDKSERERGWTTDSSNELGMAVYAYALTTSVSHESSGSTYYADTSLVDDNEVLTASINIISQVYIKCAVDGLDDDGSGTYTGSAGSIMESGGAIAHFTLRDTDFGLGISSGDIDTSAFDSVHSSQDGVSLNMAIAIDRETYAHDFLSRLCRQSQMIIYKLGMVRLHVRNIHH